MEKETSYSIGQDYSFQNFNSPEIQQSFMSLPSPPEKTGKELNIIFLKFIWDNKPDKISRSRLFKHYLRGGLNMVDLEKFIIALKASWIKIFWYDEGWQWTKLIDSQSVNQNYFY